MAYAGSCAVGASGEGPVDARVIDTLAGGEGGIGAAGADRTAGEGMPDTEVAERLGVSRPTVNLWRERYATAGIAALDDEPPRVDPRR
jgi:hypothetical protein